MNEVTQGSLLLERAVSILVELVTEFDQLHLIKPMLSEKALNSF